MGEACRLQIRHFVLYIFIIFAIFYFSEHGKQDFSLNGEPKFFFLFIKAPVSVFIVLFCFFRFCFSLSFCNSVGFQAFSGLSDFHFGRDRQPLRLVSYKEEKASLLIFLGHAQQVFLGQASSVSLLEFLLVLERKAHLLFLEERRVELQLQSPKGHAVSESSNSLVCSSPGVVSVLKAF